MSLTAQFRAQKAKATIKASETPGFSRLHGKTLCFPLAGAFTKAKPDKTPGFSRLHGKILGFPLAGTFAKAKPDKAVKRQSGYYGCRRLHKRAEKLGVQVRKCYLSILSMLIKASEGIDTEPT